MKTSVRIAIVQEGPVHLDLEGSLVKAGECIAAAATQLADLVVFGEAWLSGYPAWLDHCPDAALWDHEATKAVYARMRANSVTVPGPATEFIAGLARKHGMVLCMGVNEIVRRGPGNGTMYNSLLLFDERGRLQTHHRKLMPTFTEKLLYGQGDAAGLRAADTGLGRIGGLICWEHWMPLARQALHQEGERIHIALWPNVHERLQLASRHYAFEGRCFVVAAGQIMAVRDLPPELALPPQLRDQPEKLLLRGGSCIIAPDGFYELEPVMDRGGLIIHDVSDLERVDRESMTLDVAGHYSRPDVFDFAVHHKRDR